MYMHKQIHMYVCEYIYVYTCVHAWSFCRVWLCSPVDCRLPDFSDVFRQEYWNEFRQEFWMFLGKNTGVVAISSSRGSSWLRDRTRISCVSCIGRQILFFFFKQGKARTQSPTTTNYAVEFPTFGEITGVSASGVQWISLALGERPSWSWYLPWQADSLPLSHEGNSYICVYIHVVFSLWYSALHSSFSRSHGCFHITGCFLFFYFFLIFT